MPLSKLLARKNWVMGFADWGIVAIGVTVISALSFGNMSKWSIWFDEAFSSYITKFSFIDIAKYTANDVHPPLYYYVLKLWGAVMGNSEVALRSLSLLWLVLAMIIAYIFVKKSFGRAAAAISLGLLTLSPMLLRYSDEARMYTMAVCIMVCATAVLASAMRSPSRKKWAFYGILIALGVLTHYLTLLVWIAHWCWRYLLVKQAKGNVKLKDLLSRGWVLAHIVALLVGLPWLPIMIWQVVHIQGGGFWIAPISFDTLPNYIANLYMYFDHNEVTGWWMLLLLTALTALILGSIQVLARLKGEQRNVYLLIVCVAVLPILFLIVGSLPPLRSSFVDRYLMTSIFFWAIWTGVTFAYLLKLSNYKKLALIGLSATFIAYSVGVCHLYIVGNYNKDNGGKHSVKYIAQVAQSNALPGEPIIIDTSWHYYEAVYYDIPRNPMYFQSEDSTSNGAYAMLRDNHERKITDMSDFGKKYPKMWYIVGQSDINEPSRVPRGWSVVRTLRIPNSPSRYRAVEAKYIGD